MPYAYNGTGGCNGLFPTSITKGGLTTYSTWNCTGGVKLTDTDASGNTTTYGYKNCSSGTADPFWRVMSVTDPLGNEVCKTYPSGSSPDTASSSFSFNSGTSVQNTTVTSDGYGSPILTQKQQGPSSTNYDTVSTTYTYGTVNNVYSTLPCTSTLGSVCSAGVVGSKFYDTLGRLVSIQDTGGGVDAITYAQNDVLSVVSPAPSGENNKQVQKQYDGLGRLTSSCAVSSTVSGNVGCGQNVATSPTNGILTTTSYSSTTGSRTVSSTRGSQTRSKTVDGLGRVTSVTTPEGGTTTYSYDSSTTNCPSG